MKLPPEGARWLVSLRWIACASIFIVVWLSSAVLHVVVDPLALCALYGVGGALALCNLAFWYGHRNWATAERDVQWNIFMQITVDLIALTLLLYFSDLPRNPFLFFFVFHMIIASMYLHGPMPYVVAAMATIFVGVALLGEYQDWIPLFPIHFPGDPTGGHKALDKMYLIGLFVALSSSMWFTVYFTVSIHYYVDRTHAQLRQKEKMLGIGQLVAGIAHQIANPLDGVQNCLRRIGERVKDDEQLNEYIEMMGEALERIERTAKRVQAFARPRGITLQDTNVNQAVEGTLQVLGTSYGPNIQITTTLGNVESVQGDPYTLQEVLFNLCTNAIAAMPHGGTLTLRTYALGRKDEDRMDSVAIDVGDTGVGIPHGELEKIFEPFYTTRGESGGTGLGLGLCRMLIYEMGGRIKVNSTLGQGATFTVILNAAQIENATEQT